jgi:mono/diheme cytochrome c family protein
LRAAVCAVALAAALAGCGGASAKRPEGAATLFRQDCGACHSLAGNESLHKPGGDLLGYDLAPAILRQFTREMPVHPRLTPGELTAIVDYVYRFQQRARGLKAPQPVHRPRTERH